MQRGSGAGFREDGMAIQKISENIMQQSPMENIKKNIAETTSNYENKNPKEKIQVENKGLKVDTKA
jgi:hypothetical protein